MKKLGFLFLLLTGITASAQGVLNNYKYIIVPVQFDGFKGENQFQTSTLVKYYLSEKGLDVHYDNALPKGLNSNRCQALSALLDDLSTTFTTRVEVAFIDCDGNEVYRTQEGYSKRKTYMEAYREAIGEAFNSLKDYKYAYKEPKPSPPVVVDFREDVKKLPPTPTPDPGEADAAKIVEETVPDPRDKEETVLAGPPEVVVEAISLQEAVAGEEVEPGTFPSGLYAQKTETGYQLVDTTPSIQFYLMETSLPDVFMAERKGVKGILFLKDDRWIFEFYQGADRMQEVLQIKF